MTREEVYKLIDGEREYQEKVWGPNHKDQDHTVGDWITFMDVYLQRAKVALTDNEGTKEAMGIIRKVTALGVVCMENNHTPSRW